MSTETCHCLRKTERKSKGGSSNESEKDNKSKMMSGSKDLCGVSARKRNNEKATNNDVTFIVLQKNARSMHSSEPIEEMVCELEGYWWVLYYCVKRGGMTKKKYGRHTASKNDVRIQGKY